MPAHIVQRGIAMKKNRIAVLSLSVLTLSAPVLAHRLAPKAAQDQKAPELSDIKGTVRSDDGKITFVADEGGKSWDVINPEVLKDRIGQHVQLSAHVYPEKNQIHVMTVAKL
jgi:hypothetical protein